MKMKSDDLQLSLTLEKVNTPNLPYNHNVLSFHDAKIALDRSRAKRIENEVVNRILTVSKRYSW